MWKPTPVTSARVTVRRNPLPAEGQCAHAYRTVPGTGGRGPACTHCNTAQHAHTATSDCAQTPNWAAVNRANHAEVRSAKRELGAVYQVVADLDVQLLARARFHLTPKALAPPSDLDKVALPNVHLRYSCVRRDGISGNSPSSVRCRRRLNWSCRDSAVHPHHTSAAASGSFTSSTGSAILYPHVLLSTVLIAL